jgi:hypothetical protein
MQIAFTKKLKMIKFEERFLAKPNVCLMFCAGIRPVSHTKGRIHIDGV